MSQDHILALMARKLSGEATAEELETLEQWLAQDRDAAERFKLMQQHWEQAGKASEADTEAALQRMLLRLDLPAAPLVNKRSIRMRWPVVRMAASVILVAVAGLLWFLLQRPFHKNDGRVLVEKHNAKGIKSTIELTDGSKIWLNADSRISYPPVFAGNTREVYLHGEAFFEVAKNPLRPFIIHLANGTIRVLGTSFNVRAYDNEKLVETSVATGKVAFIPNYTRSGKKRDTIFLTPNNKVRYLIGEEELRTTPTSVVDDKAWTEGRLVFHAASLEEIATVLERNFGKKIIFVNDHPRNYHLTGSFQNNSLEEILFYFSRTKDFSYKITNTEVLIAEKASELP